MGRRRFVRSGRVFDFEVTPSGYETIRMRRGNGDLLAFGRLEANRIIVKCPDKSGALVIDRAFVPGDDERAKGRHHRFGDDEERVAWMDTIAEEVSAWWEKHTS